MKLRGAVVVLGAGASRGARLGGVRTPPLDMDFLSEASSVFGKIRARGKNKVRVLAWKAFKRQLGRAGLKFEDIKTWRLEQLSTFLEARTNLKGLQLGRGKPREYARALDALKTAVAQVLVACNGDHVCEIHRMFFEAVSPKGVISFNYDLIADQTLLAMHKLNWSNPLYRGAKVARVVASSGKSYFRTLPRIKAKGTVPLIKLHGSINWEKLDRGEGFRLGGCRLPDKDRPSLELISAPDPPFLIPPVASKIEIKDGVLRERWRRALVELHKSSIWVIWGYSFPQTDTIAQVLFKTALARNRKPKRVIVVNPDAGAGARIKEVCKKVRVEHFQSMERLLVELRVLGPKESA